MIFGYSTCLLSLYTIIIDVFIIVDTKIGIDPSNPYFLQLFIPCLIIGVYALVVFILLIGLIIFHTNLILANQTTSEDLRSKYVSWGGNPYDYGYCSLKNFNYFWKIQESLVYG